MFSNQKHSQTFLPGTVTADQIIRDHYRKLGAKGGGARSAAQTESRRRLMKKINAKKWGKNDNEE